MLCLFIGLLFLHWLGDFVCQTRWMADNKSKRLDALSLHVFVYSLVLFCGLAITTNWTINDLCRFALINFVLHWTTDVTTSKLAKNALENKEIHKFFAIVGADQFLHATTLILTGYYLLLPIY